MTTSCLVAEDLTFGYPGHPPLLARWGARFEPGQSTAITGPSGRGKSTLLYLLGLMLQPWDGTVRLSGVSAARLSDRARARYRAHCYGFVFQDAALDPSRTILDNVTEAAIYRGEDPNAARSEAMRLLGHFGVELRADHRPGQVSGGQAQRVALCRALLAAPAIVLADEPTGNLDPATTAIVVEALRQHAQGGATVIIVTHDEGVAASCDRRIEL